MIPTRENKADRRSRAGRGARAGLPSAPLLALIGGRAGDQPTGIDTLPAALLRQALDRALLLLRWRCLLDLRGRKSVAEVTASFCRWSGISRTALYHYAERFAELDIFALIDRRCFNRWPPPRRKRRRRGRRGRRRGRESKAQEPGGGVS